ncbi:MAG: prepilin-type N-terminal cleavage/methylation domain-containing protein [Desulfobulbales bacterium]|nr:prepilin-type N-terminal cleavage/methylation domain-containing protein [Desulfobulbales bacterium]
MEVSKNTNAEIGFTLIELIIVVVILGIIGVLGADFISQGFKGFLATDHRVAIYEEGKIALVRMEREIRNAVPNAIDSATLAGDPADLRFAMLDEDAMAIAANVFGQYQENPPTTTITDLTGPLALGAVLSIYNRTWDDFTDPNPVQRRLYTVSSVAGSTMTISKNLTPPRASPRKRYYAVDRAVRYYLDGAGTLLRAQLPINSENVDFATLPAQPGYPLARNVSGLTFSYSPTTLMRNAVVTINFTITKGGEAVNFHKEVHVRNVP